MEIIELLNKIAKGEKVPKSIIFFEEQYFFEENNYTRLDENNCNRWLFDDLYEVINILNCEVEILEDNTQEIRLGVDNNNTEYIEYKNDGCTESGYTKDYSTLDIMFFKRIKKLEEILNKQDTSKK